MPKAKLRHVALGGRPDDVEHSFYEALHKGDLAQLMNCWAEEEEIVCVHPGGPRLIGSGAIRSAFEALFARGPVLAHPEQVHKIESLASAVHHLVERIDIHTPAGPQKAWVVVTNVFHKTPQGWRMVAHHASPGTASDIAAAVSAPAILH